MVDDGSVCASLLVEGIVTATSPRLGYSERGTLDLGLPDRTMATCIAVLPLGGCIVFWRRHWLEVALWWSGGSLPASMMVGLGGVAPWSLDEGRVLRYARRVGAPSSAMVALMVGLVRGFASIYHSGDELAESGRGDFRRMHTRCYLQTVPRSRCLR
jgi:hypothetical protein